MSNAEMDSYTKFITSFLIDFASNSTGEDVGQALKKKKFLVHHDRLFRRTKKGLRLVTDIPTRSRILQGMSDDVGH